MFPPRLQALGDAVNRAESSHMRSCDESHMINPETPTAVQVGAVEPANVLVNIVHGHAGMLQHAISESCSD